MAVTSADIQRVHKTEALLKAGGIIPGQKGFATDSHKQVHRDLITSGYYDYSDDTNQMLLSGAQVATDHKTFAEVSATSLASGIISATTYLNLPAGAGGGISATGNGLSLSGSDTVILGGTLVQSTNLDLNGFKLDVSGTNSKPLTLSAGEIIQASDMTDGTRTTRGWVFREPVLSATTDANEGTLDSFTVEEGFAYLVEANLIATGDDNEPSAFKLLYKIWNGGTDSEEAEELSKEFSASSTHDATIDYVSGVARLRITGRSGKTVHWIGTIKHLSLNLQTWDAPPP